MITPYLEQLIHQGKAAYRSLNIGGAQQFVINIPKNGYIVIYEYYFKPLLSRGFQEILPTAGHFLQYVNFVNDEFFHPYSHYANPQFYNISDDEPEDIANYNLPDYQKRDVYIIARNPFSIYFTFSFTGANDPGNIQTQPLPLVDPIYNNLGYAGQSAITFLNSYHQNLLPINTGFTPFPRDFTRDYLVANADPQYNQLYFQIPFGVLPVADPIFPIPFTSLGKAKTPHLTLNYVEIYEEQPGTYQP
jgi:hypothetical protein